MGNCSQLVPFSLIQMYTGSFSPYRKPSYMVWWPHIRLRIQDLPLQRNVISPTSKSHKLMKQMSENVPENVYITKSDKNHFLLLPFYTRGHNLPIPLWTVPKSGESFNRSQWGYTSQVGIPSQEEWGGKINKNYTSGPLLILMEQWVFKAGYSQVQGE